MNSFQGVEGAAAAAADNLILAETEEPCSGNANLKVTALGSCQPIVGRLSVKSMTEAAGLGLGAGDRWAPGERWS